MADWAGKLVGAIGRIAGLLHMADFSSNSAPWESPIETETLDDAIRIGRYLLSHARVAFGEMGLDQVTRSANAIRRWIEHSGLDSFSQRDLHQAMRSRFKQTSDSESALDLLVTRGFIRLRPEHPANKPGRPRGKIFEVNPIWTRSQLPSEARR